MRPCAALLAALAGLMLTACGFQPVYGGVEAGRGPIAIGQIDGRTGHTLRRALMQETARGLPGLAEGTRLDIDLDEAINRLAFEPDGAASRASIRLTGRYSLETSDGAMTGQVRSEAFYNVPDAPYADIAAQRDAAERAARVLATRIVDDLQIQLAQGDDSQG